MIGFCRMSSDLYTIDDSLPFILNILLANIVGLLGIAIVLSYVQVTKDCMQQNHSTMWIIFLFCYFILSYLSLKMLLLILYMYRSFSCFYSCHFGMSTVKYRYSLYLIFYFDQPRLIFWLRIHLNPFRNWGCIGNPKAKST